MTTTSDLSKTLMDLLSNPARTQRIVGKLIRQINGGESIIFDPSSAAANVIEAAATIGSNGVDEARALDRKRYAIAANSWDDLMRHMSDDDYVGIYSNPARGTFGIAFELKSLFNIAIPESIGSDVRKLIIPRNTTISNGVHRFTLLYPIIIRIYPNNGIQVMYDVSTPSPLGKVTSTFIRSNVVSEIRDDVTIPYLTFEITPPQLELARRNLNISSLGGLRQTIPLSKGSKFNFCRVFIKNINESNWREIHVKYANAQYDPSEPTAIIRVNDTALSINIPLIYSVNNLINNTVRVDVYTTAGKLDYLQSGFSDKVFNMDFTNADYDPNMDIYTAPLDRVSGIKIIGIGSITGGTDGLTFEQLRQRYILRSQNGVERAITTAQIRDKLSRNGYDLELDIDNLTSRAFLATRLLPSYIQGYDLDEESMRTVSGLGLTIGTLQFNIMSLGQYGGVTVNGDRATIMPNCLFTREGGKLAIVPDSTVTRLMDPAITALEELVLIANSTDYLFTPFHYRIGTETTRMYVDAFQLDRPRVVSKYAVQVNVPARMAVSTSDYAIAYRSTNDGYTLALALEIDEITKAMGYEAVKLQLSFIGDEGGGRNYINGIIVNEIDDDNKPIGDQWIYHFHIKSSMDLNISNRLIIHDNKVPVDLEKEFDLVVVAENYVPEGAVQSIMSNYYKPTELIGYVGSHTYMAVTLEKVIVHFGDHLKDLWLRHRTMPEETQYRTYAEDVQRLYSNDVLERDDIGLVKFRFNSTTGKYETTVIHRKGDPMFNEDGTPDIQFRAGQVMKDEYQNPIPLDGARGVVRQLEFLLVDGKYYFANDDISKKYYQAAVATLGSWVINDIPELISVAAENTSLSYYPKDTMSRVSAMADDGLEVSIDPTQYVAIDYYMSEDRFNNVELKDSIAKSTAKIVNDVLSKSTVSVQDIEESLKTAFKGSVLSVRASGLFNDQYNTVTISDNTSTFILDKRLEIQPNMTLAVVNNIDIRFHKHAKNVT